MTGEVLWLTVYRWNLRPAYPEFAQSRLFRLYTVLWRPWTEPVPAPFSHGVTVRMHVFDIPSVAVIVTVTWLGTVVVVTVKVADLAPAGTVTVAGTMTTLGSLLVRVT